MTDTKYSVLAQTIHDLTCIVADSSRRIDQIEERLLQAHGASSPPQEDCIPTHAICSTDCMDGTFAIGQLARIIESVPVSDARKSIPAGTIVELIAQFGKNAFTVCTLDSEVDFKVGRHQLGHLLHAMIDHESDTPGLVIHHNRMALRLFVRAGEDGTIILATLQGDIAKFCPA